MKNLNSGSATIGIIVAVIIAFIIGYFFIASPSTETPAVTTETEISIEETLETTPTIETSVITPDTATELAPDTTETVSALPTPTETPLAAGIYTEYNESLLSNAEDGTVLIFFHATWCPSCRTLDKSINANLDDIPDGVTILKADYDTEKVLKKKYGVVRQHTLVQVDSNGNKIKTLTGLSNSLNQVVKQI